MSFKDLKSKTSLEALTKKLTESLDKKTAVDDRIWKPQKDKSGTGYAVIRFLPPPEGEEDSWVKVYRHSFQGPGGWYIENCLSTLGQTDPVMELNREMVVKYGNGDYETFKKAAPKDVAVAVGKRSRQTRYYSNIYVIKDAANPENEGKVFLYCYGQTIFKKIAAAMKPAFEDESAIVPFDFWDGADFRIKIVEKGGYPNYDNSDFAKASEFLGGDDELLEAVYNKEYSLQEFVSPDQFKTHEQLETQLRRVLGKDAPKPAPSYSKQEEELESMISSKEDDGDVMEDLENAYRKSKSVSEDDEDSDDLKFFEDLVNSAD
jgi:hypothetical protein